MLSTFCGGGQSSVLILICGLGYLFNPCPVNAGYWHMCVQSILARIHWNGKVVKMTSLFIIGYIEGKLQRPQWRPEQSPWRHFRFCKESRQQATMWQQRSQCRLNIKNDIFPFTLNTILPRVYNMRYTPMLARWILLSETTQLETSLIYDLSKSMCGNITLHGKYIDVEVVQLHKIIRCSVGRRTCKIFAFTVTACPLVVL